MFFSIFWLGCLWLFGFCFDFPRSVLYFGWAVFVVLSFDLLCIHIFRVRIYLFGLPESILVLRRGGLMFLLLRSLLVILVGLSLLVVVRCVFCWLIRVLLPWWCHVLQFNENARGMDLETG